MQRLLAAVRYRPTHWVYPLVCAEVLAFWHRIHDRLRSRPSDPPPTELYLLHCLGVSADGLHGTRPVVRAWHATQERQLRILPAARQLPWLPMYGGPSLPPDQRSHWYGRRYFPVAMCCVAVRPDQHLLFNFIYGKHSGEGWVRQIHGRGRQARLDPQRRLLWAA